MKKIYISSDHAGFKLKEIIKKLLIKNVNSEARNSEKFKNKDTSNIVPTFQTNYTYPLQKQTDEFNHTLTPKLSLNLSLPHTKDIRKENAKIITIISTILGIVLKLYF